MAMTEALRLQCLELAAKCTTNNKDRAMEVAREFIAFVEDVPKPTPQVTADKPKQPRKTAGKTAASKGANTLV